MTTKITALEPHLKKQNFLVHPSVDGYFLVHPAKNKFDWAADELGFRSALLDSDAKIVSVGWPKFFNQGEWPDHDAIISEELASGRAIITHKHDGSLIIRSVLPSNKVIFRTRGSADGGEYGVSAEAVARSKYPELLDPTVFPEGSLLFEYVGTENQIVVRYEGDDELIFLGAALHSDPTKYLDFDALRAMAAQYSLRLVEVYDWAGMNGIATVLGLIQGWEKAEGVVVRSGDGQTLLKIKSAWYFAQHALRWHMTYESIVRFVIDGGILDEPGLVDGLTRAGWDFEIIAKAKEHFAVYLVKRAAADELKAAARAYVDSFVAREADYADERERRKAFAMPLVGSDATPESRAISKYAFFVYDNKETALDAALLKVIMARG
jgi:hypothetical protein